MRKKIALVAAIIIGIILGFFLFKNGSSSLYEVQREDLVSKVEFVGTVKADKDLELAFEVSGKIKEVFVTENQNVKAGDKLVELESNDLRAELSKANANLSSAIASYNQQLASVEFEKSKLADLLSGSTPEEISVAQANVEIKRSELEKAESLLAESENEIDRNIELELTNLKSIIQRSLNSSISSLYEYTRLQFDIYPFESDKSTIVDRSKGQFVELALGKSGASRFENISLSSFNGGLNERVRNIDSLTEADTLVLANEVEFAISYLQSGYESFRIVAEVDEADLNAIESEKQSLANLRIDILDAERRLRDVRNSENEKIASRTSDVTIAANALQQADLDLNRVQAGPTQSEIDIQEAAIRQAESLLGSRSAQANIQRSQISFINAEIAKKLITAPIDGTVTRIEYNAGEIVPASEMVVELLATEKLTMEIELPERNLANVKVGKDVEISFETFPGINFTGKVQRIDRNSTLVDQVPVFITEILLDPSEEEVLAGMTGDVFIVIDRTAGVIAIPEVYLNTSDTVLIERDGKSIERQVETGKRSSNGLIEIVSGLDEGEFIFEPEN